jgi:hypothetical protein
MTADGSGLRPTSITSPLRRRPTVPGHALSDIRTCRRSPWTLTLMVNMILSRGTCANSSGNSF